MNFRFEPEAEREQRYTGFQIRSKGTIEVDARGYPVRSDRWDSRSQGEAKHSDGHVTRAKVLINVNHHRKLKNAEREQARGGSHTPHRVNTMMKLLH